MRLILVIDSAHLFIQYVELVVNRYGYGIKGVHSAREALEALASERIDLVIAQENLPDMVWSDFCRRLHAEPEHTGVPVLVLSADPASFDDQGCEGISVVKARTRPVSIRDLVSVIQKYLPYENKRRGIRAPVSVQAAIREGEDFVPCQVLNLSEGGLFIMKKDPYPMGTAVDLRLILRNEEGPLPVTGKVVYVVEKAHSQKPRGMGIKFDELETAVRKKLQLYLERHISSLLGR